MSFVVLTRESIAVDTDVCEDFRRSLKRVSAAEMGMGHEVVMAYCENIQVGVTRSVFLFIDRVRRGVVSIVITSMMSGKHKIGYWRPFISSISPHFFKLSWRTS